MSREIMEQSLKIVVLCSTLVTMGQAYPSGAPVEVCETMMPGHGVEPQTSAPPYNLWKIDVLSGGRLQIFLRANKTSAGNTTFKGFMLQVRNNEDKPFGEFRTEMEGTKVMSCPPGENNMVTHSNRSESDTFTHQLDFLWKCPTLVNGVKYVGEAYAIATIVREKTEFWVNVRSEPVYINMS